MWNIIKSIRYSLRREMTTYLFFLITIIVVGFCTYDMFSGIKVSEIMEITGSKSFVLIIQATSIGALFLALMIIPIVFAGDFTGKYIHYEILSGHKRNSQILSRTILSVIYVAIYFLVMIIVPVTFFTVINGWGYSLPLSVAIRQVVLLFLYSLRFSFIMAFICFALKNSLYSIVVFFVEITLMLPIMLLTPNQEMAGPSWIGLLLSVYNMLSLGEPTNTYLGFAEGMDVTMYEFSYAPELMPALFAVPVMVTVFCILAMYAINSKRDY